MELLEITSMNEHTIKLVEDKQLPYATQFIAKDQWN